MAVTLDVAGLRGALRLGSSAEETAEATRLLAFSAEAISRHLSAAYEATPEVIVNEGAVRLAAYLYDQPNAGRGVGFANAMRGSGCSSILLPYRVHRAGSTAEAVAAAQEAFGSAGNPVVDVVVSVADSNITVVFADGTARTEDLPAGMGGGADQTARDAAATAQSTADTASAAAAANTATLAGLTIPTEGDIDALVQAGVSDWAEEGNTEEIPDAKINTALRGTRVYVQTSQPATGRDGDIWIQDVTTTTPEIYEHDGTTWRRDYAFFGGRVHVTTAAHDVNTDSPAANAGDALLELVGTTLKLYRRRNASGAPYWELIGTAGGGAGGGFSPVAIFNATVDILPASVSANTWQSLPVTIPETGFGMVWFGGFGADHAIVDFAELPTGTVDGTIFVTDGDDGVIIQTSGNHQLRMARTAAHGGLVWTNGASSDPMPLRIYTL